jgi:hypothetical protein
VAQAARRGIHLVDADAVVDAVARGHDRRAATVERDVVADVDVVRPAVGVEVQLLPGEVVDRQPAELVGADHRAQRRVGRVDPDGWIVGGVAGVGHRRRLGRRGDRRVRRARRDRDLPRADGGDERAHGQHGDRGALRVRAQDVARLHV